MNLKALPIVIVCVSLFTVGTTIARAQTYEVTDLGLLSPTAINAWAQVQMLERLAQILHGKVVSAPRNLRQLQREPI